VILAGRIASVRPLPARVASESIEVDRGVLALERSCTDWERLGVLRGELAASHPVKSRIVLERR